MTSQRGIIQLVVPLLLLVIGAVLLYLLVSQGVVKLPQLPSLSTLPKLTTSKEPTVALQKQYQNPFDKSAQYVNPFSEYKNPFDALKQ